ncbi:MAG: DUF2764 family protein [Bacteroidales bacterium]|jgi:hypothetical protein|nr:DUF2764 family protein [Bacteroidales bacterium]
MSRNYEYIISSLPALSRDWRFKENASFGTWLDWIKSQLDDADKKTVDALLDGFKDENLDRGFYQAALSHGNAFIRNYFTFDLNVRNAKARFLNKAFGRKAGEDTIDLPAGEFPEAARLEGILATDDLLGRERALDDLMWTKISELSLFNYFDLDAILAFLAKLHIIDRWFSLDEETGRDMFRSLVDEVRGTFKGVNYVAPKD